MGLPMLPPNQLYSICYNFEVKLSKIKAGLPLEPDLPPPNTGSGRKRGRRDGGTFITPTTRQSVGVNGRDMITISDLTSVQIVVDDEDFHDDNDDIQVPILMGKDDDNGNDKTTLTKEETKTRRLKYKVFINLIMELMDLYYTV